MYLDTFLTEPERRESEVCTWISVHVQKVQDGCPRGEIFTCHTKDPQFFQGLTQMAFIIDEFYEKLGVPVAEFPGRSDVTGYFPEGAVNVSKVHEIKDAENCRGKLFSFLLQVRYRQGASFQGVLVWPGSEKQVCFRSALELQKMVQKKLDAVVEAGGVA